MKTKKLGKLYFVIQLFIYVSFFSQEKKEIDPSNPTNLYTQVNTNLEYQETNSTELYGMRVNIQYAFNPDNLVLAELPILYSTAKEKIGVGDARIRYFHIAKKGITNRFTALVPFVDILLPLGNYEKGLGTSSWSFAGGVVAGFIVSKKLSIFPGMSYVYITKPNTELIPNVTKFSSNGIGFQFNASYKFSAKTFIFINPTPTLLVTNGSWKTVWSGELNLNHIITPNKFKANMGWSPNFTSKSNLFKVGATFYL